MDVLPLPASAGAKAKRFIPIAPALPNGLKDLQSSSSCTITVPVDDRQRAAVALRTTGSSNSTRTISSSLSEPPAKRPKHKHEHHHHHHQHNHTRQHSHSPVPPVELPPLLFSSDSPEIPDSPLTSSFPEFGVIPSLSEISSLAGSGCTCGIECNCPGCSQHRGHVHADPEAGDCPDGCQTCVDNTNGIELPGTSSSSASIIDRFFAQAAALPPPPVNRKMGVGAQLDPMNIMVYPKTAIETKERGVPFGLITVPKLECCGGNCGCPDGQCGCGKSCDGCCSEHNHGHENAQDKEGTDKGKEQETVREPVDVVDPVPAPARSCCSGKVAVAIAS
ncbi:copper-binding transcription factor [Marasmius tenuissimus]|uniref:Copper-binding transcription factor n=1 Tax=Marasmius tenuissimus TaxID=585030 RepID=A0ABR2ZEA7_9AGAR